MELQALRVVAPSDEIVETQADTRTSSSSNLIACAVLAVAIPLVLLPWFFGGTVVQIRLGLIGGLVFALAIWLVLQARKSISAPPFPTILIPLLLALLFGLLQIVSVPSLLLWVASPESHALWRPGANDAETAGAFGLEVGSPQAADRSNVSLYPASTRHDLAELCLPIAAFFIAVCFLYHSRWLALAGSLFMVNGAVLAFFGIGQYIRPTRNLYVTAAEKAGGLHFASFINRDHASAYLNLCMAIGLAFLAHLHLRGGSNGTETAMDVLFASPRWQDRLKSQVYRAAYWIIRHLAAMHVIAVISVTCVTLLFLGIIASSSPIGMLAGLSASLAVTWIFLKKRRVARLPILTVLMAGAAIVPLLTLADGALFAPRAVADDGSQAPHQLLQHWRDGLATAGQFWRAGSGLGTYRYAYLLNRSRPSDGWFYHAENQYLEALVEGGLPGLILLLTAIVLVATACQRLLREPSRSIQFATGLAGAFALISQATQGFFDFALYLPANSTLFAIICGSVVGHAARLPTSSSAASKKSRFALYRRMRLSLPFGRPSATAFAACCAIVLVWAAFELHSEASVKTLISQSAHKSRTEPTDLQTLDSHIERLATALRRRPDDAGGQIALAELWILRYRQQTLAHLGNSQINTPREHLWEMTRPIYLHQLSKALQEQGRTDEWHQVRTSSEVQSNLAPAARCLLAATRANAVLKQPYEMLAELSSVLSQLPCEDLFREKARLRAPGDLVARSENATKGRCLFTTREIGQITIPSFFPAKWRFCDPILSWHHCCDGPYRDKKRDHRTMMWRTLPLQSVKVNRFLPQTLNA